MWLYRHTKTLLDGSCHSNGSWTTAHTLSLVPSVAEFAIDVFAVMGGDIDKCWIEFTQPFNVVEQAFRTRPLQRGQYLERELSFACFLMYKLSYGHNSLQKYKKICNVQNNYLTT
jgi:hypothetical protein